ncbi:MAG: histidinol-phosphate transaminase [Chloroflexi bacterium]|nr:histidinol-phosphate transaminase [Chloroflexota bacterium]
MSLDTLQLNPHIQPFTRTGERDTMPDIQQQSGVERVYNMANNENPLGPSPRVIAAIANAAPELNAYPAWSDIGLRRAIVDALGRGLTAKHIYTGCSGFEALELIARSFLRSGDELILSSPTFRGAYEKVALPLGARVIDVPLEAETFRYRPQAVLAAITEKTRLIMVCNPNNPTGTVITADAMDELMSGLPEHVLVVADEVYHHFVSDVAYPDSLQYVLDGANLVIVHSFSKAYAMAGLRLGYGIAKPAIADYIAGLHRGFHQNKCALAAGIAACEDQAHLLRAVAFLQGEARWLCEQLDQLDIRYWKPAANFLMFETNMPADELNKKMLERGFFLRPQTRIGLPYCMRVSLGTRAMNLAFVEALAQCLG